ncbi:conjugal transfer protein TraF [Candidatus Jidaibacter acanthamoebae]|uniref:conjugal transfer protein TraF n=1 Tax=Candidatus Jidaibacter acanthamoebae TaxID=86105 RepID=UPI00057E10EE|nr:conjugal transfer protein TraF [Candidatus Jidaibacter acanthamoeba]
MNISHFISSSLIIFIIFNIIPQKAYSFKFTEEVCKEYKLGKSWYCEPKKGEEQELTVDSILNSPIPAEEKAVEINKLWELQRKRAVISGKREDLEGFLDTQFLIGQKGIDFARNIQRIIESNPKYSNNQSYYQSISDQAIKEEEIEAILRVASNKYGLAFIYSSGCPYCMRQLPILQALKEKYNISILGISVDGNYYNGLSENITDPSVTNDPLVQSFPTILLIDKASPAKIFLSKGLITLDELEARIVNRIIERESNEENN